MRALIIGCGYVGLPLALKLASAGAEVFGLRRTAVADELLRAGGVQPLHADITKLETKNLLPSDFDWVVNCTSSGGGDASDYRRIYFEGNRNLVNWLSERPPKKFVFTSSTSVYAQNDGSWVDETSPTEPAAESARILMQTEKFLRQAAVEKNFPAIILRVAGIYGPDRAYLLKQALRGEVRAGEGARMLNMIHRDDLIHAIMAALEKGQPGEIYNVADDEPVSQNDFYSWLGKILGKDLVSSSAESPVERKRGLTNKKVSNRKLKDLGVEFSYPTFREGYMAEIERLRAVGLLNELPASQ